MTNNRSLAMAEVVVHLTLATLPADYVMLPLFIPDEVALQKKTVSDLPPDWNPFPHPATTRAVGGAFVAAGKYCMLQIPSVVTRGDYSLLLNPAHPDFKRIRIVATEKFPFDNRIFGAE